MTRKQQTNLPSSSLCHLRAPQSYYLKSTLQKHHHRALQTRNPDPKFRVIPSFRRLSLVSHLPRILSIPNLAPIEEQFRFKIPNTELQIMEIPHSEKPIEEPQLSQVWFGSRPANKQKIMLHVVVCAHLW